MVGAFNPHRRQALGAAAAIALLAAGGCATVLGPQRRVVTAEQIERATARHFPRRYPLAGVVDLTLQPPQISLLPEANRVRVRLPLEADGLLLRRAYPGVLDLDFALRYDEADHTVRVTAPQVRELRIDGLPPRAAELLAPLGPRLAQQALEGGVLYTLRPEDVDKLQRLGLRPGPITVRPEGLVVDFVPRP